MQDMIVSAKVINNVMNMRFFLKKTLFLPLLCTLIYVLHNAIRPATIIERGARTVQTQRD